MQSLRAYHRFATIIVVAVALFLAVTGVLIQGVDLRSIATRPPATDPNVMAMREAFDGPGYFAVRQAADYAAPSLPAGFTYAAALPKVLDGVRRDAGRAPLTYLEFRMADGRAIGRAGVGAGHVDVDAATGAPLATVTRDKRDNERPDSARNTFKHLHRMTSFGNWALAINVIVGVGLVVLIVTGSTIYWKLWKQRRRLKRTNPFWSGGGQWRSLHRSISLVAALFLSVVTLSGLWLAVESLSVPFRLAAYGSPEAARRMLAGPPAPPLRDGALPAMLGTTLAALRAADPGASVTVLRLRRFGTYDQGVVVTGGPASRQLVFDASTGRRMGLSEPGYPPVVFPFGWQAHQTAKSVHRGDYFGLTGRVMDLLSGLALAYLTVSGLVMYWTMWRKRRNTGRKQLVWR